MTTTMEYGIISKLYKARQNLLAQLKECGFDTKQYENCNINELNSMYQSGQQDMIIENDKKEKIYINFRIDKGLRPQYISDLIEDLYNLDNILQKTDMVFIICKSIPNDTIKTTLIQLFAEQNIFINVLSIDRLQFNIFNHNYVPKHRRLDNNELLSIKNTYNINDDSSFCKISRFDPVAQLIGLRPNEVCEITRNTQNTIESKFYRICVNK